MIRIGARRLSTATLALAVWLVLTAGAAQARVGPDDPATVFLTPPAVVVTEQVSWTRYALIAAVACLVGIAATVAVQFVLRHLSKRGLAHA